MKALLGDLKYLDYRIEMQKKNLTKGKSQCWDIVTYYYYFFYIGTYISRFYRMGNLYFNKNDAAEINNQIDNLKLQNAYKIKAENYTFRIEECKKEKKLLLYLKEANKNGVHETLWGILYENIFNPMKKRSIKGCKEEIIMDNLGSYIKINTKFLSIFRNKVNYQLPYGKKSKDGEIGNLTQPRNESELYERILRYVEPTDTQIENTDFFTIYGCFYVQLYERIKFEIKSRSH